MDGLHQSGEDVPTDSVSVSSKSSGRFEPSIHPSTPPSRRWWIAPPGAPEPRWWIRDFVVALILGAILLAGQAILDDQRSSRELQAARVERAEATRLENQRFVRALSGPEEEDRPFQSIDLGYRVLSGLQLAGANFNGSLLINADLSDSGLRDATFLNAYMSEVDLKDADLQGADLRGADLTRADLRGTNLSRARLTDTDLGSVCYDGRTQWPSLFFPDDEPYCSFVETDSDWGGVWGQ